MESVFVNWEALDSLVIEFAKSEHLIEDSSSPSSPPSSPSSTSTTTTTTTTSYSSISSSSYRSRLIIRRIRRCLETGDVDSALDLLRTHAPSVLDDHRLLFRLQKQKFIELLRRGTKHDRHLAIDCLRKALAPCALDAYPEAYEEFKHVLLALIFDKDDRASPVASEWSERRRTDIAGLLSSFLRAHLNAYDPVFSMTLRYLISIHKGYCFRQGLSSPISDLTERLLLEERDPPPIPKESLYEAPPFDEVDIQALAHAVDLTRQGAIDSLRFSKGDLLQAFQNELCRVKPDVAVIDELVHEYCIYRGIVDGDLASSSGIKAPGGSLIMHQADNNSSNDCPSISMDFQMSKPSDGEVSISNAEKDDCQQVDAEAMSTERTNVELRSTCEVTSNYESCSTSEVNNSATCRKYSRSRGQETGERRRRKRWRGRIEMEESNHDVSFNEDHTKNTLEEEKVLDKRDDNRFEFVLEMKDLASKGKATEVVEEVNSKDPIFFVQNPVLLFQLKQVEFLKLVNSGNHFEALRIASSCLGPLVSKNPSLLKPLKETLVALLRPDEDALVKAVPFPILASSLQEFLALPRADAIHLLAQYNGNAETVIQEIFT